MKFKAVTGLAASVVLLVSSPAQAYLDPNVGSMLLQGLLAGFAAAGVVIKTYWHRILAFFQREKNSAETPNTAEDEVSEPDDERA